MKLQSLVVIFVIIILPISMLLTAYTQNQIKTLNYQTSYDTKLNNATYDALKAFQLNTINSSTSDLTNSKIRDIEASANTFFDAISENFNMAGYRSDALKDYVPALVFTMYDGYYIYSLYDNKLDQETQTQINNNKNASIKGNGEKSYGLKPYIYYSCRYVRGDLDVVITYALDNYITVQGIKGTKTINLSGYLINGITKDANGNIKYRGVTIEKQGEDVLTERVGNISENTGNYVNYVKTNGVKYYKDGEKSYSLINGTKYAQDKVVENKNTSAYNYYADALNLQNQLRDAGILDLQISDAVDEQGQKLTTLVDDNGNIVYDFRINEKIFQYSKDGIAIEEPDSTFNQHRLAVIRYAIEKNLSIAIANYNSFTEGNIEANFQMPRLQENEWEKILNNISIISFLQGLSIGGKIYNGYSIVTNNKNEEVVTENSIYITDSVGNYHKPTDIDLVNATNLRRGYFNIDFERKSIYQEFNNIEKLYYYYPQEHLACYNCVVSQDNVISSDNIYKYMDEVLSKNSESKLPKLYYTALGRERYSMYKVNNY